MTTAALAILARVNVKKDKCVEMFLSIWREINNVSVAQRSWLSTSWIGKAAHAPRGPSQIQIKKFDIFIPFFYYVKPTINIHIVNEGGWGKTSQSEIEIIDYSGKPQAVTAKNNWCSKQCNHSADAILYLDGQSSAD